MSLIKIKYFQLVVFLFFINTLFAQIDLTMPADRMVYQRNKQNVANIYVGGSFHGQLSKIEARLVKLDSKGLPKSPLDATVWYTVTNNPQKGNFLGTIPNIKGGWYNLEVRAYQKNEIIGEVTTIKVGVGEVFMIAGQSNAQGETPIKSKDLFGAKDDRVNCINAQDFSLSDPLKYPVISHLEPYSFIAPTGKNSWCWGPLGDLIAKNWDVPVIFFNTAIGGTSIFDWRAGSVNESIPDPTQRFDFQKGEPFIHLKKSINYYGSLMGMRAVLWAQGESDVGNFEGGQLDPWVYKINLEKVIQQSRFLSDRDISWVIAKSSLALNFSPRVITGQQFVIDLPNFNVFEGPNTDLIQAGPGQRDVGDVHFWGNGLLEVGNAWFNSLNTPNFLINSKPIAANPPQAISLGDCVNNNQISAKMSSTYTDYSWYHDNYKINTRSQTVTVVNKAQMIPYMKDVTGKNYIFSPPVIFKPQELSVVTDIGPNICEGQTVNIFAKSFNDNFLWSDSTTSKSIPIKTTRSVSLSVKSVDVYGCVASASGSFNIVVNPIPSTPKITTDVSPITCEGKVVVIKPEAIPNNYKTVWSDGDKNDFITIGKNGSYSLIFKDSNNCESKPSNIIEVVVNPNPKKPDIIAGGSTTFCAESTVPIATSIANGYQWYLDNKLEESFKTQFINASLPGVYSAKIVNEYGCSSPFSDEIKVSNYPLPESPTISKTGNSAFCAGGSVELNASGSVQNLKWHTNEIDSFSQDLKITISSKTDNKSNTNITYFATSTDDRGCVSKPSEKIIVSIRVIPSVPRIDQLGTFALESKTPILGIEAGSYQWFMGQQLLGQTDAQIKVSSPGIYTVKGVINYTLPNNQKLSCISNLSTPYNYIDNSTSTFSVYPNPTRNGIIKIDTKEDISIADLKLFTPLGQLIFETKLTEFNAPKAIDLNALPDGVYKLRFSANGKTITKSLLIDR